uniref:Uncharacterized protein n=1 Tax=Panagrolaimus superbus TaxID=310955 RepID=A0A914ZE41_9BILA
MVFHVGVSHYTLFVYDDIKKEATNFVLKAFAEDLSTIDLMYEEIKSKAIGELGCACFSMFPASNDFRKKLVQAGLDFGFKKVQILDYRSELYIRAIFQSKYKPKNGDVIWIFQGDQCHVWKKENNTAKYYYGGIFQDFIDEKDLEKFKIDTKLNELPDIILSNIKFEDGYLENFAPHAQNFSYSNQIINSSAVSIKTQIMAGVSDVLDLDANAVVDYFFLKIGNKNDVLMGKNLPFTQSMRSKLEEGENILEIKFSNHTENIELPTCIDFFITLKLRVLI